MRTENALTPPVVPAGEQDDVARQERQAEAAAPVDPVSDAVAHPEMQIDRGQLRGREGGGEVRPQPGQEPRDRRVLR
jgi:hypothetical protein